MDRSSEPERPEWGILETSREVVKLAVGVANPELVEAAMKVTTDAFELSSTNFELQKRVAELEKEVEELNIKLHGRAINHRMQRM